MLPPNTSTTQPVTARVHASVRQHARCTLQSGTTQIVVAGHVVLTHNGVSPCIAHSSQDKLTDPCEAVYAVACPSSPAAALPCWARSAARCVPEARSPHAVFSVLVSQCCLCIAIGPVRHFASLSSVLASLDLLLRMLMCLLARGTACWYVAVLDVASTFWGTLQSTAILVHSSNYGSVTSAHVRNALRGSRL